MRGLFITFGFGAVFFLIIARVYLGEAGDNLGFADIMYLFSDLPFDIGEEWIKISEVLSGFRTAGEAILDFSANPIEAIKAIFNLLVMPVRLLQTLVRVVVAVVVDFTTIVRRFFAFFFGLSSVTP